jgi:hypothetical protein
MSRIWIAGAMLVLAALACNFSFSSANIGEAYMSLDEEGQEATETYAPGDTFYAFVELNNAPVDTELKAVWSAVDVSGEGPGTELESVKGTSGSGQVWFKLEAESPWPSGKYRVEIFLNNSKKETLDFEVVEPASSD